MSNRKVYPISQVNPNDTKTELTCSGAQMVMIHLENTLGKEAMEEFVYENKMNIDYLSNRNNWISLEYYYKFLDNFVKFTNDSDAPFKAGTYASSRKCMGPIETLITRASSVKGTYAIAVYLSPRWSKVNEWKMLSTGKNTCTISVRNFTYPQNKNNCLCIQGVLAAFPRLKGLPLAEIKETQCACKGADSCIYEINWISEPKREGGKFLFLIGLLAGIITGFSTGWSPAAWVAMILAPLLGYFMGRDLDYKARLYEVHKQNDEQAMSLEENMRYLEENNFQLQNMVQKRTESLEESNKQLLATLDELQKSRRSALLAERQAAVGILASATAHGINSPMNAILLSIQAMSEELEKNSPFHAQLQVMSNAANRCKRIIDELLSFSREPKKELHIKINQTIEATLNLFEKEHPSEIKILRHIPPKAPPLIIDSVQIRHILLNLLNNAAAAVDDKGIIEVSLDVNKTSIIIKIKDNGPGMSKEVLANIFDPFFTTKKNNKGLGLGLSIVHNLVCKNGGSINATSEPGKGTEFTIIFPLNRAEPPTETIDSKKPL